MPVEDQANYSSLRAAVDRIMGTTPGTAPGMQRQASEFSFTPSASPILGGRRPVSDAVTLTNTPEETPAAAATTPAYTPPVYTPPAAAAAAYPSYSGVTPTQQEYLNNLNAAGRSDAAAIAYSMMKPGVSQQHIDAVIRGV